MTGETTFVFGVLAGAVILFASGRLRPDVVALCVVLALVLSEVLTLREGLAGFGDPVIIMMASLFVVGEALLATGVALAVGEWLMLVGRGSETRLLVLLMLVVGALGSLMGSTGVVALFLPIVLGIANKSDLSPRRLLMPLAFAALIGGMMTLIGATANLVVNAELQKQGLEKFGFFDFTPIGIAVLLVGVAFMVLIGRKLSWLSRRLTTHSWPMISAVNRLRLKPCRAVEQKLQLSAQPTCEDMHSVARSGSGM